MRILLLCCCLALASLALAQVTVTGKVLGPDNKPVAGARVIGDPFTGRDFSRDGH